VISMADDAGRLGLLSHLKRCWAPKPGRPSVAPHIGRESLEIFAAVCPQWGHVTAWIFPSANSPRMTLLLAQVAAELADYFMVMRVDRAGWPLSHPRTSPDNRRLLPQPSGSPELPPVEHLGDDWRENDTAHRLCDALEDLEIALGHGINRRASDPAGLRSMTHFPSMQSSL
jgi:hypothetical protein